MIFFEIKNINALPGKNIAKVPTKAPQTFAIIKPANVAMIATGPGVNWLIAVPSINSCSVSKCKFVTNSLWMTGITTYPPPKKTSPILKNIQKLKVKFVEILVLFLL
jgi:hypothetical protein